MPLLRHLLRRDRAENLFFQQSGRFMPRMQRSRNAYLHGCQQNFSRSDPADKQGDACSGIVHKVFYQTDRRTLRRKSEAPFQQIFAESAERNTLRLRGRNRLQHENFHHYLQHETKIRRDRPVARTPLERDRIRGYERRTRAVFSGRRLPRMRRKKAQQKGAVSHDRRHEHF